MTSYPEYVKVGDKKYKINTDFRYAIECNRIAEDSSINDLERSLAIIYTLYGDEGIDNPQDYEKLLQLAQKYLLCGNECKNTNAKPDMSFTQDMPLIEASFMSDFKIDLENTQMHWWKFFNLMNGLSNSELGNCCVLNNIRNLRNMDEKKIEDKEVRKKVHEAKMFWALEDNKVKPNDKQLESAKKFMEGMGLWKE